MKIKDTVVDLFSVDYKVDLSDAKEKLANDVALAGNIDAVRITLEGIPKDVK